MTRIKLPIRMQLLYNPQGIFFTARYISFYIMLILLKLNIPHAPELCLKLLYVIRVVAYL